jgi:hypothetical protein
VAREEVGDAVDGGCGRGGWVVEVAAEEEERFFGEWVGGWCTGPVASAVLVGVDGSVS